jgi:hypothetical protein
MRVLAREVLRHPVPALLEAHHGVEALSVAEHLRTIFIFS